MAFNQQWNFLKALRQGNHSLAMEHYAPGGSIAKAAMASTAGATGGYLVPEGYSTALLQSFAENSILWPRATTISMKEGQVLCPKPNIETALSAGQSPFFMGIAFTWGQGGRQGSTVTDITPTKPFKQMGLYAWDLIGDVTLDNQLLADMGEEGEKALMPLFGAAAAWYAEYAFFNGLGAANNLPMGILNAPGTLKVNRGSGGFIQSTSDFPNMAAKMYPLGWCRAIWVCSPTALQDILNPNVNTTATGFVPNMNANSDAPYGCAGWLLSRPLFVSEKLPALGTPGDLIFIPRCTLSACAKKL
jgi:HK97 family phage major capsid protein